MKGATTRQGSTFRLRGLETLGNPCLQKGYLPGWIQPGKHWETQARGLGKHPPAPLGAGGLPDLRPLGKRDSCGS